MYIWMALHPGADYRAPTGPHLEFLVNASRTIGRLGYMATTVLALLLCVIGFGLQLFLFAFVGVFTLLSLAAIALGKREGRARARAIFKLR